MGGYFFLISVVLLPVICARLVAGKGYTFHLAGLIGFAGIAFLLMLLLFNDEFPFAGGGDDEDYFYASNQSFTSLGDWFDMARYEILMSRRAIRSSSRGYIRFRETASSILRPLTYSSCLKSRSCGSRLGSNRR